MRAFIDAVFEQLARIGRAVSAPKRLELPDLLVRKGGLEAQRLELGVSDWRARDWWLQTPRVERGR